MTIKRAFLIIVTVWAIAAVAVNLWESWSQPQFQSRLDLFQTNLVLQVKELQGDDPSIAAAQKTLLGTEPLKTATEQYQEFRRSAKKNRTRAQTLLETAGPNRKLLEAAALKADRLLAELDLRIGILQAEQNQMEAAQRSWLTVMQTTSDRPSLEPLSKTAGALAGLWSDPPQLFPNAESLLRKNLDGWFRYRALMQLYQLQQRQDALARLQAEEQQVAARSFTNLAIVGAIPILGCLVGIGILLFLGGQWLVRRKQALLAVNSIAPWTVPWDGEVIWQVMIFGFFLAGQVIGIFVMPLALAALQQLATTNPALLNDRTKAFFTLLQYLLVAGGTLGVLYVSIKPFLPLSERWFQAKLNSRWIVWGLGGYFAALPLVILISAINQKIWQGQGGSNPILPVVLENQDRVALLLFFVTAAIAAPIFEELLFRGFLLPSLTRYFPIWGAIALSSLIFAVAHLSLSEVLPLTVLGMVLGFVYTRSGNLLSSMLLHSLWNSGTLLSLFILGNSAQ